MGCTTSIAANVQDNIGSSSSTRPVTPMSNRSIPIILPQSNDDAASIRTVVLSTGNSPSNAVTKQSVGIPDVAKGEQQGQMEELFKILVIGPARAGKTVICKRLEGENYFEEYIPSTTMQFYFAALETESNQRLSVLNNNNNIIPNRGQKDEKNRTFSELSETNIAELSQIKLQLWEASAATIKQAEKSGSPPHFASEWFDAVLIVLDISSSCTETEIEAEMDQYVNLVSDHTIKPYPPIFLALNKEDLLSPCLDGSVDTEMLCKHECHTEEEGGGGGGGRGRGGEEGDGEKDSTNLFLNNNQSKCLFRPDEDRDENFRQSICEQDLQKVMPYRNKILSQHSQSHNQKVRMCKERKIPKKFVASIEHINASSDIPYITNTFILSAKYTISMAMFEYALATALLKQCRIENPS
eukprot:gene9839-2032_t